LSVGWWFLGKYINANIADNVNWIILILSHVLFLSIFIVLALAIFGISFIKYFIKNFKKEIMYILLFTAIAYAAMTYIWGAWVFFSDIVTKAVYNLLKLTFDNVVIKDPRFLSVNGFGVSIGEACSGLYSMFLFICANIMILALEWNRIQRLKGVLMLIPGLVGIWFVNIVRIYLLMLVGVFISPKFAIGMFHSYIGSLLFLIYTLIYIYIFYRITPRKKK
jgi:exosortase/archaeosortase family protein